MHCGLVDVRYTGIRSGSVERNESISSISFVIHNKDLVDPGFRELVEKDLYVSSSAEYWEGRRGRLELINKVTDFETRAELMIANLLSELIRQRFDGWRVDASLWVVLGCHFRWGECPLKLSRKNRTMSFGTINVPAQLLPILENPNCCLDFLREVYEICIRLRVPGLQKSGEVIGCFGKSKPTLRAEVTEMFRASGWAYWKRSALSSPRTATSDRA
jgi:hypothetical protein